MKRIYQLAAETNYKRYQNSRFIYQGDRPSNRPDPTPDPAEALEALALDEAQTERHEQALQMALERWAHSAQEVLTDVNNDLPASELFNLDDNGSIHIQVERIMGINSTRPIITGSQLSDLGLSPETAITYFAAHIDEFIAIDEGEINTGALTVDEGPEAGTGALTPEEPDPDTLVQDPETGAWVDPATLETFEDTPETFIDDLDVETINNTLDATDIEERVDRVEFDEMNNSYIVYFQDHPQITFRATGIEDAETLTNRIYEELGMGDEEVTEVVAETTAPSVEAILEAYGSATNKGGILTAVNEAMGYARGSAERITSIWGQTQARLESDAALRLAFGEALGLVTAAPATAEEPEVEAPVVEDPVEEVEPEVEDPEAPLEAAIGAEMDAEQAQSLIESLDGLTGRDLQTRINELATQLGISFPDGRYVENGQLVVDGSVGRTTREAMQQVVEVLQRNIPVEADTYISVLDNLANPTNVDEIIEAIRGNQVHTRLLQRDLQYLGFYSAGIDGVFGAGSRRGLEAALNDDRFETVYDIERAARDAEVVAEGERFGRNNPSVDALMAKILSGEEITAADVAFTGADQGGMTDRTREVIDFVEQAVANEAIDQTQASQIVELMMREEVYDEDLPQEEVIARTLEDADGRFLPALASVNPETRIREISPALVSRVNNDRAQLIEDMHASTEVHTFGPVSPENPIVEIDGHEFDMRTLTKMYILTGGGSTAQGAGAVELPIGEMTSALQLHNLVYRDGALVGTMENGCEGNLVIIPVDRQYVPTPPPVVRVREPGQPRNPGTPPVQPGVDPEPIPEGPERRCRMHERCQNGRVEVRQQCWNRGGGIFNLDQTFTKWTPTGEGCHEGGDGGDGGDGCGGCGAGGDTSGGDDGAGNGGI